MLRLLCDTYPKSLCSNMEVMRWQMQRRLMFIGTLLVLALSACDWDDNSTIDVAVTADGEVVGLRFWEVADIEAGDAELPTGLGEETEVTLSDGTEIRLVDNRSIVESTDGFASATTVWEVNPEQNWWFHHFGPGRPGAHDIIVAPDGSVAVAGGAVGVVERLPDGSWTPSVSDLRTLPLSGLVAVLSGLSVLVLSLVMALGPHVEGRSLARYATFIVLPFTALSIAALDSGQFGVKVLTLLSSPSVPIAFGLAIASARRSRATPNHSATIGPLGLALLAVQAIIYAGFYVLWSRDLWPYAWSVRGSLITTSLLIAIGVATLRRRVDPTPLLPETSGEQPPPPPVSPRSSTAQKTA